MLYLRTPITLLWVCLFLSPCSFAQPTPPAPSPIGVVWELVTNFTEVKDAFEGRMVLQNNGTDSLTDRGWALYFNMAPRPIIDHPKTQPAKIHHINGDWYRLIPEPGFNLPPGNSIEIRYMGMEPVIKEADAPIGLYFVLETDDPRQPRIESVADYQVVPFSRPEQLNRGPSDQQPIPTPEQRYRENEALHLISNDKLPRLIPTPRTTKGLLEGTVRINSKWSIAFESGLHDEAKLLADEFRTRVGLDLATHEVQSKAPIQNNQLRLSLSSNSSEAGPAEPEAYNLVISDDAVEIFGGGRAGVFYAMRSLFCLMPVDAFQAPHAAIELPQANIVDYPRFAYRGLHIDVSRNFQSVETIQRIIDVMALYKLNRLLLYTTEDEGWRIEIPGLPELTSVGAQRQHNAGMESPSLHPAYGSGPIAYAPGTHGSGYYTRDQFIDLLRYAARRHVKIIPEVNFPGHARAAIKSMEARYNRLMTEGNVEAAEEFRLIDPEDTSEYLSAQAYKDNVVSVARDSTYRFYHKVLDELSSMYAEAGLKMDEIHTGGDEVPSGAWTGSPMAKKLLDEHPEIGGPENLQAYFFGRLLTEELEPRGLKALGWEEVFQRKDAQGNAEPNPEFVGRNATAYIWNNLFDYDLGNRLANIGYPVVLCNVSNFYFDLAYDKDPKEPGLYWAGFVNEKDAFLFAPFNYHVTTFRTAMGEPIDIDAVQQKYMKLAPAAYKNIVGVEAQLWSETIKGREMVEYYMLPKLIGFAESAWAQERRWETTPDRATRELEMSADWNVLANCIGQRELPRLAYWNGGYNYRVPPPGAIIEGGMLKANNSFPGLTIRYTTDGSEPNDQSSIYTQPTPVTTTVHLRAFDSAGHSSRTVSVSTN